MAQAPSTVSQTQKQLVKYTTRLKQLLALEENHFNKEQLRTWLKQNAPAVESLDKFGTIWVEPVMRTFQHNKGRFLETLLENEAVIISLLNAENYELLNNLTTEILKIEYKTQQQILAQQARLQNCSVLLPFLGSFLKKDLPQQLNQFITKLKTQTDDQNQFLFGNKEKGLRAILKYWVQEKPLSKDPRTQRCLAQLEQSSLTPVFSTMTQYVTSPLHALVAESIFIQKQNLDLKS